MQILINNNQTKEAYILNVFTLNVMNSLTFVTIANTNKFYSLLLKLVKEGIISSFEPNKDIIKVSIRTKYIESID